MSIFPTNFGLSLKFDFISMLRKCVSKACVADALKNLFGEQNARHGTIKLFEVMQDVHLNKHLFYVSLQNFREIGESFLVFL